MGETAEDQPQVRSVRRGRPPKVATPLPVADSAIIAQESDGLLQKAQDLADRIRVGFSPDVPKHQRDEFIRNALVAQNYQEVIDRVVL